VAEGIQINNLPLFFIERRISWEDQRIRF
jgi:hypothetical protein